MESPSLSAVRCCCCCLCAACLPAAWLRVCALCCLLGQQDPLRPRASYIGKTSDPVRRLAEHNGGPEAGGARETARGRPWSMVLCVHGFPGAIHALQVSGRNAAAGFSEPWPLCVDSLTDLDSVSVCARLALSSASPPAKFEWAWQNPRVSRHVAALAKARSAQRSLSAPVKFTNTVRGRIALLYNMLALPYGVISTCTFATCPRRCVAGTGPSCCSTCPCVPRTCR